MTRYVFIIIGALSLYSCGKRGTEVEIDGKDGSGCTETRVLASNLQGAVDQYGGVVITCSNGSSFVSNGSNGQNGSDGLNGANGKDGSSGNSITTVQLCPGTPAYPSEFIEVAFCINSELYAVYSTNGGFMTKLTPGAYRSNAVGSKCDFTVTSGCQISN